MSLRWFTPAALWSSEDWMMLVFTPHLVVSRRV
jgi:hypothetical protein